MSHLAPDNVPLSPGQEARWPIVFAGKRSEVLEQALAEPNRSLKPY